MEQYFLNKLITYGNTTKTFVKRDDGHRTYFKPSMGNTDDAQERFCICFFANLNFIVFLEGHISVNFIKSYQFNSYLPLIDNKTHLVATLEN